jgi:pheromone a factor receptor
MPLERFVSSCCRNLVLTNYLSARNSGICLYIFWTGAGCLISCINSIIWHGNALNSAPTWCEICQCLNSFRIASNLNLLTLRINRYKVSAGQFVWHSCCVALYHSSTLSIQLAAGGDRAHINKSHAMAFDLVVGLGLPLFSLPICMPLYHSQRI